MIQKVIHYPRPTLAWPKKRGNTVKIYRPLMTKKLNQLFTQPFEPMQQTAEWYSKDIALIEFDNNNRPVSIMTRAHQAFTTIGVNSSMYTTIFFGNGNMRHFENNVSNSLLEDAYLRTAS